MVVDGNEFDESVRYSVYFVLCFMILNLIGISKASPLYMRI